MRHDVLAPRRPAPADSCRSCGALVDRVWLVPGDVDASCAACFRAAAGRDPVHEQGHTSTADAEVRTTSASAFYVRADGRRPA